VTDFPERERRGRPRIEQPFSATVRGVDATGERLDIDAVLDNMSTGGLYVRIPRPIEPGTRLTFGIRVWVPGALEPGARIAARGVVKRVNATPRGEYGLAVEFTRHRVF
jgi:PilZ domain-containing protein